MLPGFFDNLKDHSEIKLRILGRFLAPWAAKLGSVARRGNRVIWYVDGFAGAGRYGDGSDGSPLLGLHEARRIRTANRGYELASFFVDINRNNWRLLEGFIEPFRDEGLYIRSELGEFSNLANEIEGATRGSPMLLFVDPFGIKPLVYLELKILLARRWPIDLILTFQHTAVPRLAKNLPHLVTQAIGSDAWRIGWHDLQGSVAQTDHVLRIFSNNLRNDGNFLRVVSYPIRQRIDRAPRYYLMFASRHYDAFELWNDQVAQEDTLLSQRHYRDLAGQTSFLPQFDDEIAGFNLLNGIRAYASSAEEFTRQDVVMHFVQNLWSQYRTKDIKSAVASLLSTGELVRDYGLGKGIDNDIMRRR